MQSNIGAVKIKDGLFVGDEYAAQDLEFVVANKVTHIVNCAGKQISNHWEPIGVKYLTFNWADSEGQVVLDSADKNFNKFFTFLEASASEGTSSLIHSVKGTSRSICVLISYLMKKYAWNLYKTVEFVNSRRNDIALKAGLISQLSNFEAKLVRSGLVSKNSQWDWCKDLDEEVLKNTFLNAQVQDFFEIAQEDLQARTGKLTWGEEKPKITSAANYVIVRSCLKGADKTGVRIEKVVKKPQPKRSASLNLQKHSKEPVKPVSAPPKESLFREILQTTDSMLKARLQLADQKKKRPITAPDKKKKPRVQSSSRSLRKST